MPPYCFNTILLVLDNSSKIIFLPLSFLDHKLSKKFNNVIVWDGMLSNVENFNDFKAAPRGNEIFAVASKSSLQSFKSHLFMHPVESGMLKFSLSLLMPTNSIPMGMAGMIPVRITNLSPIPVRSQNPYPVNLSYHILITLSLSEQVPALFQVLLNLKIACSPCFIPPFLQAQPMPSQPGPGDSDRSV